MKPFIWHALALALFVGHPVVAQETTHFTLPSSCASKTAVTDVCIADLQAALARAQKKLTEAMLIADVLDKEYSNLDKKADSKNANFKIAEAAVLVSNRLDELQTNNKKTAKALDSSQEILRKLKAHQYGENLDLASASEKASTAKKATDKADIDKSNLAKRYLELAEATSDEARMKSLKEVYLAKEAFTRSTKEADDAAKVVNAISDMAHNNYSTDIEVNLNVITKAIQSADSNLIHARQNGNRSMILADLATRPHTVGQTPTAEVWKSVEKRRIFLTALEAHPLFISSLSGSGASFSVNGQSNKITLRQTVKRSWDKAHNFSVAIGLNKTEDEDNKIVTRLDGFDSDWSFQGSYNYLGLLRDSHNDAHDIFGFAGVDVTKGRETVSYLDPATSFSNPAKITKLSTSNQPWSIAAHAGFALDNYSVRYKLMHKHGWDVNPKSTVCPAMPTNGHFTCTNIPVGVPDRKVFNVSAIDLRMSFKHWAFSPAFRYDHANRIKELVLPVHLPIFNAGNGKNLTAGLVPSWRSDDRWHLGIFAGSSFDLIQPE